MEENARSRKRLSEETNLYKEIQNMENKGIEREMPGHTGAKKKKKARSNNLVIR